MGVRRGHYGGSEGTGWEEWICGFKSVAEACCDYLDENPCAQVFGLVGFSLPQAHQSNYKKRWL